MKYEDHKLEHIKALYDVAQGYFLLSDMILGAELEKNPERVSMVEGAVIAGMLVFAERLKSAGISIKEAR